MNIEQPVILFFILSERKEFIKNRNNNWESRINIGTIAKKTGLKFVLKYQQLFLINC